MGPPRDVVLDLAKAVGADTFIETGTYRGDTVAWARPHFARVVSIEASESLAAAAARRFQGDARVQILSGDSGRILPQLVAAQTSPAVYWLDAHWSGGETHGAEDECPLLEELAALDRADVDHLVLVDDARCFGAPPPRPHRMEDWPDLSMVMTALERRGTRWVGLFEDVLVAVPRSHAQAARRALQDAATSAWRRQEGRGPLRRWLRGWT